VLSGNNRNSGRNRPARHLVGVSAEMAKSRPGADHEGQRTILCDGDAVFVLYRLAQRLRPAGATRVGRMVSTGT